MNNKLTSKVNKFNAATEQQLRMQEMARQEQLMQHQVHLNTLAAVTDLYGKLRSEDETLNQEVTKLLVYLIQAFTPTTTVPHEVPEENDLTDEG